MGLDKCSGPKPSIQADRVWAKPTWTRGGTVYLYNREHVGSVNDKQSSLAFAWIPAEAAPPMDPDHRGGWVRYYARSQDKQYVGFDPSETMSSIALDKADDVYARGYSAPADKQPREKPILYMGREVPKNLAPTLESALKFPDDFERWKYIEFHPNLGGLEKATLIEILRLKKTYTVNKPIELSDHKWTDAELVATSKFSSDPYSLNQLKKAPTTMSKISQATETLVRNNKVAVISAGYLEAGRVANSRVTKLIAPKLPALARGYADTPIGRLVVANLAQVLQQQFRPENTALAKLTTAMVTQAYSEMLGNLKIDELLDELLSDKKIAAAMTAAGDEA